MAAAFLHRFKEQACSLMGLLMGGL